MTIKRRRCRSLIVAASPLALALLVASADVSKAASRATARSHRHPGWVQPPPITVAQAEAVVLSAVGHEFPAIDPAVSPSLTRVARCHRSVDVTFRCVWSAEIPAQCASYVGRAVVRYRHKVWTASAEIEWASTCEPTI